MTTERTAIKRNGTKTREKIVSAAICVFSGVDFNEATMRDIARESGFSQANIYQYFESKDALLFSIINEEWKRMKSGLLRHLSGIKGTQNKIRKMTWYYMNFREQNRRVAWLEHISLNTKAWNEAEGVWKVSMEIPNIFRDIMVEGKKNGEVRPDADIRVAGHLYFGGLRNLVVFWLLDKQFKSLAGELSDQLTDLVWEAVRYRSPNLQCPILAEREAAATGMKSATQPKPGAGQQTHNT